MPSPKSNELCRVSIIILAVFASPGQLPAQNQPRSPDYAADGQRALTAGDYNTARTDFEVLAKLKPDVGEVHATLAAIYFKERQFDQAVREIQTAKRLKPSLPRLDSLLGLSLAESGRFKESIPGLEQGFKQTADSEVRRLCGLQLLRVYGEINRNLDAVPVAVALNRSYPADPEVLYHASRVYGNQAFLGMKELHEKAPDNIWMLQGEGEADESQKHYDSAISSYGRVLALDPRRRGVHYRLGRVYLARFEELHKPDDRSEAKKEFAAEAAVDPDNGNAAYELGELELEDNEVDQARRELEVVVARFPDFEQAIVALGRVDLMQKSPDRASKLFKRAIELNSKNEVAWYRLSRAERAVGNLKESDAALQKFREPHAVPAPASAEEIRTEVTPQKIDPDPQP